MSPCPDATHTTTRKIPPTGTQAVFTRDPSTLYRTSTHSNPWPLTPAVPAASGHHPTPPQCPGPDTRSPLGSRPVQAQEPPTPTPASSREGITEAREASHPQFPRHRAPGGGADRYTFSTNTQSGKLGEPHPRPNTRHEPQARTKNPTAHTGTLEQGNPVKHGHGLHKTHQEHSL